MTYTSIGASARVSAISLDQSPRASFTPNRATAITRTDFVNPKCMNGFYPKGGLSRHTKHTLYMQRP